MFKDNQGNWSLTKIMTFSGFFAFLFVSFWLLYIAPDKFNYDLFAILTGTGAVGTRIVDKYLNRRVGPIENEQK